MNQTPEISIKALTRLKRIKKALNRQQYCTLKGQILSGDGEAAMKGLDRILERKQRRNNGENNERGRLYVLPKLPQQP